MFRSKKTHNDDAEDDEFSTLSHSSKLASIFNDDSPTKSTKDLKFVAPKQPPVKNSIDSASHSTPQNESGKNEPSSAILYATAAELYSHKKGNPGSEGRVMCCIIRRKGDDDFHFVLLLYRTKKNVIAQAKIRAEFDIVVQKNNYVSFTDDVSTRWSLFIDGIKYQEFLTQIGICRALSAFAGPSPPPRVIQLLSEGEGSELLQKGDAPVITFCSWQVQNYKRGKQIGELREGIEVTLDKGSWEGGLVNCRRSQHCLVLVPNVQAYETDKSSLVVYEVTIEALKKPDKPRPPEKPPQNGGQENPEQGSEASAKAALITRMARVGQPLLPLAVPPRRAPAHPVPPTDSESEEDHHHKRYHHGNARRSSTSSSLEEINAAGSAQQTKKAAGGHTPAESVSPFEGAHLSGLGTLGYPPYVPQGAGTVIAYHPFPFQGQSQQQQHQQHQHPHSESSSKTSESLLSLLFSETRSQNTDLRIALSQLTQKIDMVYSKVNFIETSVQQQQQRGNSTGGSGGTGVALSGLSASAGGGPFNPHDLLVQISALVEQSDLHRRRSEEGDRKLEELTREYTQVLKKNQTLLEEKAELVALKGESGDTHKESKIHLQELLAVQEQKIRLETELHAATMETQNLQNDLEQLKQKYASLEASIAAQKASEEEQSETRELTVRQLSAQIDQLTSELAEMRDNEDRLRKARRETEEAIQDMRSVLQEARREAEAQKERATKAEDEKNQLEKRLAEEDSKGEGKKMEEEDKAASEAQWWKKKTEEQEALIEQVKTTLQATEKRLREAEEQSGKTITALEEQLKNRDTYSWVSRPDMVPSRAQTEAVVKQVMNATYRRVKASFLDHETYDKAAILQSILAAIRETTLLFLARRREGEGEETASSAGQERSSSVTSSSPLRPLSVSSEPGGYESPISRGTPSPAGRPSSGAGLLLARPPADEVRISVSPPMPLPPPNPPTQPSMLPPAPPNTPPPPPVPPHACRTVSPVDVPPQQGAAPEEETPPEGGEEKSEDEEENWKPLPPPPPLFSDTDDDDDWLS